MILSDVYTIFWREMKRYKKSRSGVLIRLIQPAVWIIVIGNTLDLHGEGVSSLYTFI